MALSAPAKAVFEGSYDMEMTSGKDKVTTTIWSKDGHLRMRMSSQEMPGEMILRDGMKQMLVVMPEQRMYMEMTLPDGGPDAGADEAPEDGNPFRKTGETREILGYKAHEFVHEEGGDKLVIWATEELGSMVFGSNPMMEGFGSTMRKVTGMAAFFPLEMTGYEKGKPSFSMKVRRIERKELDDALFQAPKGFMKMTMPAGMGGMMRR
jgi:hypothetical protein